MRNGDSFNLEASKLHYYGPLKGASFWARFYPYIWEFMCIIFGVFM